MVESSAHQSLKQHDYQRSPRTRTRLQSINASPLPVDENAEQLLEPEPVDENAEQLSEPEPVDENGWTS